MCDCTMNGTRDIKRQKENFAVTDIHCIEGLIIYTGNSNEGARFEVS